MEDPSVVSADVAAMSPYWDLVSAISGGAETMRAAGARYLPRYKNETTENYSIRLSNAKFTGIFGDIVENLAQRPFSSQVTVSDDAPPDIKAFSEDVDARGNSLHVFAGEAFFSAIAAGIDWWVIDYTSGIPPGATVAQERAMGARAYWRRYDAGSVLAVHSDMIDGAEQFTHVRLLEPVMVRDGFKEETIEQVRVMERAPLDGGGYGPPTWQIWRKSKEQGTSGQWFPVADPQPLGISRIPLVAYMTGRRIGDSWRIKPPMRDAAHLQIELYQQESALKHAKTMAAFPMLVGAGVDPPEDANGDQIPVSVGPHTVLFAPQSDTGQHGDWKFIEPSAQTLNFLAADIKETIQQLRELGRQPLTAQSGNLTVVTTAFAAQKGNAAIEAWALGLKDALEQALIITGEWLGLSGYEPSVSINTDFDIGLGDENGFAHVLALRERGEISREAVIHEAKRRDLLDDDYDADEDAKEILEEDFGDDDETAMTADAVGRNGADALNSTGEMPRGS